jgi:translation elongation factor EF-Tu-like GTPase
MCRAIRNRSEAVGQNLTLFEIKNMNSKKILVTLLFLIAQSVWASSVDVVLLGDNSRLSLLKQCGVNCKVGASIVGTPPQGSTASEIASYSYHAKHALVVVDAAKGPLPITREHIQIARQAGVSSLSIMFVNMRALEGMKDAGELVELEEQEVRKLMKLYEMDGDGAMVFHDTKISSTPKLHTNGLAFQSALNYGASTPERKSLKANYRTGKRFSSYVYLLTPQESKYTQPLTKSSPVRLWVNGQVVDGAVISKEGISPGGNGKLLLETISAVSAAEGARFLLERDGGVIALGVIVRIEHP